MAKYIEGFGLTVAPNVLTTFNNGCYEFSTTVYNLPSILETDFDTTSLCTNCLDQPCDKGQRTINIMVISGDTHEVNTWCGHLISLPTDSGKTYECCVDTTYVKNSTSSSGLNSFTTFSGGTCVQNISRSSRYARYRIGDGSGVDGFGFLSIRYKKYLRNTTATGTGIFCKPFYSPAYYRYKYKRDRVAFRGGADVIAKTTFSGGGSATVTFASAMDTGYPRVIPPTGALTAVSFNNFYPINDNFFSAYHDTAGGNDRLYVTNKGANWPF